MSYSTEDQSSGDCEVAGKDSDPSIMSHDTIERMMVPGRRIEVASSRLNVSHTYFKVNRLSCFVFTLHHST